MATVEHLTDEQRNEVSQKVQEFESWLLEIRSVLETKPKHEDLPYTLADVENKLNTTETQCYKIINSSPPAPKKEEEKKEEEKKDEEQKDGAAAGDAEMKDEATI